MHNHRGYAKMGKFIATSWSARGCGGHLDAGVHVGLSQGAAVDRLGANTAVEGALGGRVAAVGPAKHLP